MYKVIIVDDEQSMSRSLKKIITSGNLEFKVVGEADDGKQALLLIEKNNPDLVITDIRMPRMDGLKLTERIKKEYGHIEVIIVSGYDQFSYAQKALRFGVNDYLLKPIIPSDVIKILKRLADKLHKNQHDLFERSEWIYTCKNRFEALIKYLWFLNEDKVRIELKEIHNLFLKELKQFGLKEMYLNLLSLIKVRILELSNNRIQLESFKEMEMELNNDSDSIYKAIKIFFSKLFNDIRKTRNLESQKRIMKAVRFIENGFTEEKFTLQNVADEVCMSPSYFSKRFKYEFGISYTKFLTDLRMQKAIELLNDPLNRICEVAYTVGYSEYAQFSKSFKKYFKFSATEYRNNAGIA